MLNHFNNITFEKGLCDREVKNNFHLLISQFIFYNKNSTTIILFPAMDEGELF